MARGLNLFTDILSFVIVVSIALVIAWLVNPQIIRIACSYLPNFLQVVLGCAASPF
jgi:hypothetical protein